MLKVLVTGGNGFIGTNLIERLMVNNEYSIVSLDTVSRDHPNMMHCYIGDVGDFEGLKTVMQGMEVVVHLAAETGVLPGAVNPQKVYDSNVTGTFNVLRAADECGVRKIVFASTGAIFADSISMYGASKLASEALCRAFKDTYALSVAILRLGNVYGPFSLHKTSVVHKFIKQLINDQPMTIRGDGMQTRSFVYVEEVVDAIIEYMNHRSENLEIVHVTGESTHKIVDVAATLSGLSRKMLGVNPLVKFVEREDESNSVSFKSSYKTRIELEEGLQKTLKWYLGVKDVCTKH